MTAIAPLDPLRLPLHGVQLIEASAGTGKTWTIAALYLRLVLGHGSGAALLPPQILVLTFTRAATAELRERIRARLGEAALAFRGQAAPDDFLAALLAEWPDPAARAHAARRLELAAQWMDEAAIHTIHGWSQRMLAQHAFASGQPFAQDLDADGEALLAEAVRDYWRVHFFPLDRFGAGRIAALWRDPTALQQALAPLLRKPFQALRLGARPAPLIDDLAAELERLWGPLREADIAARAAWLADTQAIETLLAAALQGKAIHGGSYKALPGHLPVLRDWAAGAELDEDILARYGQQRLREKTNKGKDAPEHAAFAAVDALLRAQEALDALKPRVLAHAVRWVAARLAREKRRLAQWSYDDLLANFDQALDGHGGHRLADAIARQYPVALIDEFQDTDPVQWRIFRRIYAGRGGTGLLLIGDPKQAIYGFRGADIHTYLEARAAAVRPTWTLATNHRSTTPLVRAVNRVFEHADRHPQGAFLFGRGERGLPFLPVAARDRAERLLLDGAPLPALTLALRVGAEPLGREAYLADMASHAAARIVALLDAARDGRCAFVAGERRMPLAPGDIAVLVRNRNEAATIRDALRRRALASVYLSDQESVYASAEAGDLLLWLRACAEPGSDRAMRAALASPVMDAGYAELDRLNQDERYWEDCGERFRQLHEIWLDQGVLAMLHELLHRFELPARLLARPGGERALTNLLHLAELLQQAAAGLDGEHALLRHLAEQVEQARAGVAGTADEQIVRLESEAALIKVVTVHKSKGLEYPLVFLPFVCGFREVSGNGHPSWHEEDGEARMALQHDEEAWQRAERERLQEDLRLLYVALTRARHACWLGVACLGVGPRRASALHKSAFGYVLAGGELVEAAGLPALLHELRGGHPEIAIEDLPELADAHRHRPPADTAQATPARRYRGSLARPWRFTSYSALKYDEGAPPAAAQETAAQEKLAEAVRAKTVEPQPVESAPSGTQAGIHGFHRGAEPGTFLHDLLEWAAGQGFAETAARPAELEKEIARRCQRRGWRDSITPLSQWLPALLRTPLALPDGRSVALAGLGEGAYRAELEFWFEARRVDTLALDRLVGAHTLDAAPRAPLRGERLEGMFKGFIDLLFEHEGRYYVADYKSNWLGDDTDAYTAEAMRASILRERYDLQYALYTLALHRQLRARLPDYDYDRHVGGVVYLYLRGVDGSGRGVHRERLPRALVEAMDALFAGAPADA